MNKNPKIGNVSLNKLRVEEKEAYDYLIYHGYNISRLVKSFLVKLAKLEKQYREHKDKLVKECLNEMNIE